MFDTGVTHCFLAECGERRLGIKCSSCPSFIVGLPDGSRVQGSREVLRCPLVLGGREWPTDLIVMDMQHKDILLGMSWLQRYSVVIDLRTRKVTLRADDGSLHEVSGSDPMHNGVIVSAVSSSQDD